VGSKPFGARFDEVMTGRLAEADDFYQSVIPPSSSPDKANVMRQAIAGMLWTKQYYGFNGDLWLEEHGAHPLHPDNRYFRNREWFHMFNDDIVSMPDKWEYPWYAAWDLAFHTLPISIVDPDFAKQQLALMLRGRYLHPSGQIPAYEWNFSDVNPPVHAWATLFLHRTEQALRGEADFDFLKAAFNKLLLNFTWWVNRKDRFGKNVFEGGFLGLDNIGVFDRRRPAAHRRPPRAGGRYRLDGPFQPEHGRTRRGAGCPRPHLRRHGFQVHGTFLLHCCGHEPTRAERQMVGSFGTTRTVSTMTCSDSPTEAPLGSRCARWWDLLPLCATTVIEKWQRERVPWVMSSFQRRLHRCPRSWTPCIPPAPGTGGWPSEESLPWSTRSGSAGFSQRCSMRTSS